MTHRYILEDENRALNHDYWKYCFDYLDEFSSLFSCLKNSGKDSRSTELCNRVLRNETSKYLWPKAFQGKCNTKFWSQKREYCKVKSTEKWGNLYHSHTKRNSHDIWAIFVEFPEYVENSEVVVYWRDISFKMPSTSLRLPIASVDFNTFR